VHTTSRPRANAEEEERDSETAPVSGVSRLLAGKYRVVRTIGRGRSATVVEAVDARERRVAIKLFSPEACDGDDWRARFDREARAAARVDGAHVARVRDAGVLDTGVPYVVMDFVEGEDLVAAVRRRGPLPHREAVAHARAICDALACAHARGVVHGDLAPASVVLARGPDGSTVKVVDLGLPRIARADGDRARDERDDVRAAGAVLYYMLTARPPFVVRPGSYAPRVSAAPAAPSVLDDEIPPELDDVVRACLAADPSARYQSADELARALEAIAEPAPTAPPRRALWAAVPLAMIAGAAVAVALPSPTPMRAKHMTITVPPVLASPSSR